MYPTRSTGKRSSAGPSVTNVCKRASRVKVPVHYVVRMSEVPIEPGQIIDDETLTAFYGKEFLDYVLNGRGIDDAENAPARFQQSRMILAAIFKASRSGHDDLNKRIQAVFALGRTQENGLTLAQSLRVGNGGYLPEVTSADPLVGSLARLALATFPIMSIPHPEPEGWQDDISDMGILVNLHPEYASFLSALANDSDLIALFLTEKGGLAGRVGDLYRISMNAIWSNGMGGGIQLVMQPTAALG